MQAIILCGGKGTRLKGAIPEGLPKAMADICGKPFLHYLLKWWEPYIDRFFLATGYGHDAIKNHFGNKFGRSTLIYKKDMNGTKSAVYHTEPLIEGADPFFVINGDTYLDIEPNDIVEFHNERKEDITAVFSTSVGCHAGVDLIHAPCIDRTRVAIFPTGNYFIDIGTPESLERFRRFVSEWD